MTRDEIAQMMQDTAGQHWGTEEHFQRFAALVAAHERERYAKDCFDQSEETDWYEELNRGYANDRI